MKKIKLKTSIILLLMSVLGIAALVNWIKKTDLKFNYGCEIRIEIILMDVSKEESNFIWSNELEDFLTEIKAENDKTESIGEIEKRKQFYRLTLNRLISKKDKKKKSLVNLKPIKILIS